MYLRSVSRIVQSCFFSICINVFCCTTIHAQQTNQSTVLSCLQKSAQQKRWAIVVEGGSAPLLDTAPSELQKGGLLTTRNRVVEGLGYTGGQNNNLIVLQKSYLEDDMVPDVTDKEAVVAFSQMVKILDAVSPRMPTSAEDDRDFSRFLTTLSARQADAMRQGKLAVAQLNDFQKTQVYRYILAHFVQSDTAASVERGLRSSEILSKYELGYFARRAKFSSYPAFAYEYNYRDDADGKIKDWAVILGDDPYKSPMARGMSLKKEAFSRPDKNDTSWFKDPTDPTDEDKAAVTREQEAEKIAPSSTMGSAVDDLNQRTTADPKAPMLAIEDGLRDKRIQIIGGEYAPAEEIFRACAKVYGLRVVPDTDKETKRRVLRITYPRLRLPKDIYDVAACLRHVFPDPWVRALHLEEIQADINTAEAYNARYRALKAEAEARRANREDVPDPVLLTDEQRAERKAAQDARWAKLGKAWETLPLLSVRRLRVMAESRMVASPDNPSDKRAPLADLGIPGKSLLVCAMMKIPFENLTAMMYGAVPETIKRFDALYLKGGPLQPGPDNINEMVFAFGIGFLDPKRNGGEFDEKMGFASRDMPKNPDAPRNDEKTPPKKKPNP